MIMDKKVLPGILILLVSVSVMLFLIYEQKNEDIHITESKSLIEIDKEFSAMILKQGINTAFKHYYQENGILLAPKSQVIEGKHQIENFMAEQDDSEIKLIRKPLRAEIASSIDFGMTYGIYNLYFQANDSLISSGTYITVWTKDQLGEWRILADSENERQKP